MRWLVDRPGAIAGLYLVLIPLFGLSYALMPGAFYHQNAKYEPETHDLSRALAAAVQVELRGLGRQEAADDSGLAADFAAADVVTASLTDTADTVVVAATVPQRFKPGPFQKPSLLRLTLHLNQLGDGTRVASIFPVTFANGQTSYAMFTESFKVRPEVPAVYARYRDATAGFPGGGFSHFLRMTYYSAVTITTTGYGDIAPLTDSARTLAGTEATVGVVLVGLFLWSLTEKIKSGGSAGGTSPPSATAAPAVPS
ncbi:MAG: potassium channel family protein [Gemmataceae bacterium]